MGKSETVDFSETIAASDLKVSRSRDFLRNYCANLSQFFYENFQVQGNENLMT